MTHCRSDCDDTRIAPHPVHCYPKHVIHNSQVRWCRALLGARVFDPPVKKEHPMTTATRTKLLKRETIEQLDGAQRVLSYFEPTEEIMRVLVNDLFQHNWQRIVVGPCIEGAVFEVRFAQAPKLSYLDGYLTVDLGFWHFHLCI